MNLKKMLSPLICLCLTVSLLGSLAVPAGAAASRTVANVVVFVDFADTTHAHINSTWGNCFKTAEGAKETLEMFNGDDAHPTGMGRYLDTISYGQFAVENIFPQYNDATGLITPYTLKNKMDYYAGADAIINELLTVTAHSEKLSDALSGKDLDRNGDGNVDNLTIVVPCETGNSNQKFNSLQGTFSWGSESGSERPKLLGKEVACYNLLTESSVYLSAGGSGTVIHEFLHTLGYPDLYAPSGTARPVGNWCIMSSVSRYTQYPLAYLRSQYTKWFDIPTVTESTQSYTLRAPTTTTMDTRNKQAVILRTGLSSTEFFVLEYRKLGEKMEDHDYGIHGSGLFIYRVNTNSYTNRDDKPYMVYVFRPGDDYAADGREACGGELNSSFLSSESGRTGYGSADLDATLKDNAITYSDGSNSGIMISNVGSALGDTITFNITFTPLPEDAYWRSEASTQSADSLYAADSCMASDGSIYYLQTQMHSGTVLQQYNGNSWTSYSAPLAADAVYDVHLLTYENTLYAGYMTNGQAMLSRWNGTAWELVYTAPNAANTMDISAGQDGIYITYVSSDNKTLYGFRYNSSAITPLGNWVGQGNLLANPSIAVEDGRVSVLYQDGSRVYVRSYDSAANSWKDLLTENWTTSGGMLRYHDGSLYMLKNETGGSYLYRYEPDGSWTQLGDAYATCSVSDFDLVFVGESPCVLYFDGGAFQLKGTQLLDGAWVPMGGYISNGEAVTGPRLHTDGTELSPTQADRSS